MLTVAVLTAFVLSSAHGLKLCEYNRIGCGGDSSCIDVTNGECSEYLHDRGVVAECVEGGLNFTTYTWSNCSGVGLTTFFGGSEGECKTLSHASSIGFRWSECVDKECFAWDSTVELLGGQVKNMNEIKIGDIVRVSETDFSPVYFWGHKDSSASSSDFTEIELESGLTLALTGNHMIYANGNLVRAAHVKIGDSLLDADRGASKAVAVKHKVSKRGLLNPHTIQGDIVVNGAIASTFTSAQRAPTAHMLLSIERLAFRLGFSVFGNMLVSKRPAVLDWFSSVFDSSG